VPTSRHDAAVAKQAAQKGEEEVKVLVRNKRARHDYFVEDTLEAGLVLVGSEVKSLREAHGALSDAYVDVDRGEAWLLKMQIMEYPWSNQFNHEPMRKRKLLLHRREIARVGEALVREGYTVLPLEIYLKKGRIKALLGICKGKKQYDKREVQKKRDAEREVEQAMKKGRK
jgi:SsrA-binding protein